MTPKNILPAIILTSATPALADITARDAWNLARTSTEAAGVMMTVGDTQESDGVLTVSNIRYSMDAPDISVVVHVDELVYDELGDGRVRMTVSDIPVAMNLDIDGDVVEILGRVLSPGLESILSGDPDLISSQFRANAVEFILDGVIANGEPQDASGSVAATNVVGTYVAAAADLPDGSPTQQTNYTADAVTVDAEFDLPDEEDATATITGNLQDLVVTGSGTIIELGAKGLPQGLVSHSEISHGGSAFGMNISGPEGDMLISVSDAGGSLIAGVEGGTVYYETAVAGTNVAVSGSVLPFPPVEVALERSASSMLVPIRPSSEPQEFGMAVELGGLVLSDFLWSMLDPFNTLPHDPADLALSISGTGKLAVDVFDPDFDPETMTAAPGQLYELEIDDFLLRAFGAEITANGAAENVEPNPLALPRMVGGIDIAARGIQGLMESLGQMGVLPVQQAAMANMMLGIFAVPGSEPDTFTSRIEFTEGGGILANGQPLQ